MSENSENFETPEKRGAPKVLVTKQSHRDLTSETGAVTSLKPLRDRLPKEFLTNKKVTPQTVKVLFKEFLPLWKRAKRLPVDSELIGWFGFNEKELGTIKSNLYLDLCMSREGMPRFRDVAVTGYAERLSERQQAALTILSNFNDRRPAIARLADFNPPVTTDELNSWNDSPLWKDKLQTAVDVAFHNVNTSATMNLVKLVADETPENPAVQLSAIKFYYEITGRAEAPETVNVKQALQAVIEAVQMHVKDPEVLRSISETIASNRNLQALTEKGA